MVYASVRDVRIFNGWFPVEVRGDILTRLSENMFRTSKKPIVDYDWDDDVLDDVKVYVDGVLADINSIDEERGVITLATAPPSGALLTADYYHHPVGDSEIKLALSYAEEEIKTTTGIKYEAHEKTEEVILHYGSVFELAEPIITINSIDIDGYTLTADEYEIVDAEAGIVRLKNISAGLVMPPWYIAKSIRLRVQYIAGYQAIPSIVKHASILIATYQLLLRLQRQVTFTEDYSGITMAFKTPEDLTNRLQFLRAEVARVKELLPRRVVKA
ncbi:MAG: hypothetical protein QXK84_06670 [Nitrososphaerota archaeon]